ERCHLRGFRIGIWSTHVLRRAEARGEFIQADSDGLPEIHRGLCFLGGDCEQTMAKDKVVAGEPPFFGAEDDCDTSISCEFVADKRGEIGKSDDGLLGLTVSETGGSEDKRVVGESF